MLIESVENYLGHRIGRRPPGFEFTPVMLGKVASFIVHSPDGAQTPYAFMYPLIGPNAPGAADEEDLLTDALVVIRSAIERGQAAPAADRTFELRNAIWIEVQQPRWWIPVR